MKPKQFIKELNLIYEALGLQILNQKSFLKDPEVQTEIFLANGYQGYLDSVSKGVRVSWSGNDSTLLAKNTTDTKFYTVMTDDVARHLWPQKAKRTR